MQTASEIFMNKQLNENTLSVILDKLAQPENKVIKNLVVSPKQYLAPQPAEVKEEDELISESAAEEMLQKMGVQTVEEQEVIEEKQLPINALDIKLNVSATTKNGMENLSNEDDSVPKIDEAKFQSLTKTSYTDNNGFNVTDGVLRIRVGGKDVFGRSGGATQISLKVPEGFNQDVFANELAKISYEKGSTTDTAIAKVIEEVKDAISISTVNTVKDTPITGKITDTNAPEGLPGIDRTSTDCQ